MVVQNILNERHLNHKIKKMITKQSQLSKKQFTNNIYRNELIIYFVINIILFCILFYLMIKNK